MLMALEIQFPPIEEQRRIVEILDQTHKLGLDRQHQQALMSMLRERVIEEALNTSAGRVPLGDLVESGPRNGLYKPQTEYGQGTPIVRIDSFRNGTIETSRLKRVRISAEEAHRFQLLPQDLIINRVNSMEHVGKAALVPELDEPTVFESNMMRLRLLASVMPEYVAAWLSTSDARSPASFARRQNKLSIRQA